MERIKSCELLIDLQRRPDKTRTGCLLYRTFDNKFVKIFSGDVTKEEKKTIIKNVSKPIDIEGVVKPSRFVVAGRDEIIGYTMDNISGQNDITYESKLEGSVKNNLHRIASKYQQLESIVKNAGEDIVFPCLPDRDSIIIDEHGKIRLVNYENIQVGDSMPGVHPLLIDSRAGISGSFTKYYNTDGISNGGSWPIFKKELDKKGLIVYFLTSVFGLDVKTALDPNVYNYWLVMEVLGGQNCDQDLYDKIMLVNSDDPNEFIGNDIQRIAEKYNLVDCPGKVEYTRKLKLK